jgi:hypothetical protein
MAKADSKESNRVLDPFPLQLLLGKLPLKLYEDIRVEALRSQSCVC